MLGGTQWRRWLFGAALAAAVEGVAALAITVVVSTPAQAQFNDQFQFLRRQFQRQQRERGFFGGFFGDDRQRSRRRRSPSESRRHADYSRAPAARKKEEQPDPNKPITSVVVMGGSMGDWLAYGLEDAFSDSPNVEIVRKTQPKSGLLRYKYKSDLDWWDVARDQLAQQEANFVVMMLGVYDRRNIRARDVEEEEPENADQAAAGEAQNGDEANDQTKPKPKPKTAKRGIIEFRSDQWEKVYARRIDRTIAALKSRGVPVFWVGLPSIRGTKSTADAVYLNNLYRARAQRAGAVYIDVWDGFVDDAGKYSSYGPDYEGQTRRLRSRDGVFFTRRGARKLAHYVEREIRRYMNNRVTTLTLPTGPFGPTPGAGESAVRPLAGPVLPLTSITSTSRSDVLLGGARPQPARTDAVASKVLVKGDAIDAPPGRADDFKWPPDSEEYGKPPEPPAVDKNKPAKTGPAAAAPAGLTPATAPRTQANVPPAQSPAPAQAAAPDAAQVEAEAEARAKAEAEAKKQAEEKTRAEAERRAAERARAQAQRDLRPPGRIETRRRQVQGRPQRRSNDPLSELFGLFPR